MSYYLLPKINENIEIKMNDDYNNKNKYPYISESLHAQFFVLKNQHDNLLKNTTNKMDLLNSYHFLYEQTFDNSEHCVSKLNFKSSFFYEFMEINTHINYNIYFNVPISLFVDMDSYSDDIIESIKYSYTKDIEFTINKITDKSQKFNIIILDKNTSKNSASDIYQKIYLTANKLVKNGILIMKIDNLFDKVIIDGIYILSRLFDKISLFRPNTLPCFNFEKYIICKGFLDDKKINLQYNDNFNINSFLVNKIPVFFLNKINDINIITGQKILENYVTSINTRLNLDETKIKLFNKISIEKCIVWCEKYKIPCNKFKEKINIFINNVETDYIS